MELGAAGSGHVFAVTQLHVPASTGTADQTEVSHPFPNLVGFFFPSFRNGSFTAAFWSLYWKSEKHLFREKVVTLHISFLWMR